MSHTQTAEILTGRRDFLYVADCKLASTENMAYIHQRQGRFLTVLPGLEPRTASSGTCCRKVRSGAIPKCGYAAVRLECFLVDGCVDISSPSSSAFNSARHAGGSQRHSVFRSLAIASRV